MSKSDSIKGQSPSKCATTNRTGQLRPSTAESNPAGRIWVHSLWIQFNHHHPSNALPHLFKKFNYGYFAKPISWQCLIRFLQPSHPLFVPLLRSESKPQNNPQLALHFLNWWKLIFLTFIREINIIDKILTVLFYLFLLRIQFYSTIIFLGWQ